MQVKLYACPAPLFRQWLEAGAIRAASLEDCYHTHHKRLLLEHPATKQPFVAVKDSAADVSPIELRSIARHY